MIINIIRSGPPNRRNIPIIMYNPAFEEVFIKISRYCLVSSDASIESIINSELKRSKDHPKASITAPAAVINVADNCRRASRF